jgi:hypothetical protein
MWRAVAGGAGGVCEAVSLQSGGAQESHVSVSPFCELTLRAQEVQEVVTDRKKDEETTAAKGQREAVTGRQGRRRL